MRGEILHSYFEENVKIATFHHNRQSKTYFLNNNKATFKNIRKEEG